MYTQEEITSAYGPFIAPVHIDNTYIQSCISEIREFPSALKAFTDKLTAEQQMATYRPGSWTFRQVIHHLADSHMQAYSRFKLALTENDPVIKPYIQNAWADTPDATGVDAAVSAALIAPLHQRWVHLMLSMSESDFGRQYIHPEYGKTFSLAYACGLYAWHGKHHLTQMKRYAENMGWIKA
jgi:hypothetical protein